MWFFGSKPKPAQDTFFAWSPSEHSVGIQRFDQDHRHLADLLNQIQLTLSQGRDRFKAAQLMEHLLQETRAHFLQEEEAMEAAGFRELEKHAEEHQRLLQEAGDLLRLFQNGNISALAFPAFVKNWLIGHMREVDRRYATCLRRNGER